MPIKDDSDEEFNNPVEGADERANEDDTDEGDSERQFAKPKIDKRYKRNFNPYDSTDSEPDMDVVFSDRLITLINRDFSRMNL